MRLGLLAAARITGPAVVEPASVVDGVELAAVAARTLERAEAAARDWGVDRAYGSYEALIDDPDVDAVYVATPAALHRRWTLAALAAGKHVLCEKPLAANADEAREVVTAAAAADRIVMEAFHWRYHPVAVQVRALIDAGQVGDIGQVSAGFVLPEGHIPRTDIRWDLALGGGALMDLGCYPVQWARFIAGSNGEPDTEPQVVDATAECPVAGIDARLTARLAWPHRPGLGAAVECSMVGRPNQPDAVDVYLEVRGSEGVLRVANPLAPQFGTTITCTTAAGVTEIPADGLGTTTYLHQLVAFRDAVATHQPPPTGGADSVATMAVVDACYRAAGLDPRPTLTV